MEAHLDWDEKHLLRRASEHAGDGVVDAIPGGLVLAQGHDDGLQKNEHQKHRNARNIDPVRHLVGLVQREVAWVDQVRHLREPI